MRLIAPDYYPRFRCIAGDCRHSCCIGWEIDIDDETLALYREMPGELGERVRASITDAAGTPCFRLGAGERCPHLNEAGLCEIILGAGEEYLTQICDDHPRFRSYFSDRTEIGLGLACEAAARLVLGTVSPVCEITLYDDEEPEKLDDWERYIIETRRALVALVQDRTRPLSERIEEMLGSVNATVDLTPAIWADELRGLERLDAAWDICLDVLSMGDGTYDPAWDIPLEQLVVYLLYRHLPGAEDAADFASRVAFAALGYRVVTALAMHHGKGEAVTVDTLAEYARLWSSEIEYSEENTAACIASLRAQIVK